MKEELKDFPFVLNEDEEIKQIIDFPDYWISNYGRVFSYKNSYKTRKGWKELKQYSDKNHHYLDCRISVKGKALHLPVHRYVCKYFCSGYKEGFVVNHIDGNTKNNYYKNLEWTTIAENNSWGTRLTRAANTHKHTIKIYDKDNNLIGVF